MTSNDEQGVPIYQKIKRWIVDAIARGDYDPDAPFTTERALRERFDVSAGTVVKALNDLVSEGVLVRRRGVGTFVAERAPEPAAVRDRSVAYVTGSQVGPHATAVFQGISAVCRQLGYRLFVTDTEYSTELEAQAIRAAVETGASGVLWYPQDSYGDQRLLAELERHDVPLVFVDRYLPTSAADAVIADNYAVGHRLTCALIERGHRHIATLWSEWRCTSVTDRLAGHVQALREHGLPISPQMAILRSFLEYSDTARRDILRSLLDSPEPPTAVLCANGYVLATAAHDLVTLGVRVPEDVDLAGMDDAGPYDLMPLASVAAHLPSREMGETAMHILDDRISGRQTSPKERVVLPVTIREPGETTIHLRPVSTRLPRTTR